jgi:predicted PurR-regulated permease PerM
MALESLLIGAILVILIFQIARLTNLLQHEIKPILKSTNETISTLRGTTEFLSDNLTEPVIKINEYVAAIQKFLELFGVGRRTP